MNLYEKVTVTVWRDRRNQRKEQAEGRAGDYLSTVLFAVCPEFAGCGGRGTCGRCRVRFIKQAPLPGTADRQFFTPDELRDGWRLACRAKLERDCEVELHFAQDRKMDVITQDWTHRTDTGTLVITGSEDRAFIAVDIGTTTVAMQLTRQSDGSILDSYNFLNPQRSYGLDVIARIQADVEGHGPAMRDCLLQKLEEGVRKFREGSKIRTERTGWAGSPAYMVIAGNTAMEHILLGYSLEGLGREPFRPVDTGLQRREICGLPAWILPGSSAFVGADVVAGLYACSFGKQEEICMLIDLGTNGEMAIGNRNRILATATAAGPAFEGGATAEVYGADMIGLAAKLLEESVIDSSGLMADAYFEEGVQIQGVRIRQQDIRSLQLAKAAVYAGVGILCDAYDIPYGEVSRVYLAGGFGCYLKPETAFAIGLLPQDFRQKTMAVGNSALAGAVRYGCMFAEGAEGMGHISGAMPDVPDEQDGSVILERRADTGKGTKPEGGKKEEDALQKLAERIEVLNLAKQSEFEQRYLSALDLCPG